MECKCGCGLQVNDGKQFVSGHNLRGLKMTPEHRRHIGEAQRLAWTNKRKRLPLGSTNHDANGYIRVKVLHGSGRWDKEHVLIMEQHLGRKLLPGESIHHLNGIRTDNRIENLYLCKNKSEHSRIEESCKRLIKDLYIAGLVKFNIKELRYEMV